MWLLEFIFGALFVASSGLLFNRKFRENQFLLILAGVVALVSTYFLFDEIINKVVDRVLVSRGIAPAPTDAKLISPPIKPSASGQFQATQNDVAAALAYDRHDYATAVRLLSPREEGGDPVVQYFLGVMYLRGYGVARNSDKGVALLRQAAVAGVADAQNFMGALYRRGNEVPQDYAASRVWYEQAARQGYRNAQYRLALIYRDGLGVAPDVQAAYRWAYLSALDNAPEALSLRDALEHRLTPAEATKAREEANAWQKNSTNPNPISIYRLTGAAPLGIPRH